MYIAYTHDYCVVDMVVIELSTTQRLNVHRVLSTEPNRYHSA